MAKIFSGLKIELIKIGIIPMLIISKIELKKDKITKIKKLTFCFLVNSKLNELNIKC